MKVSKLNKLIIELETYDDIYPLIKALVFYEEFVKTKIIFQPGYYTNKSWYKILKELDNKGE